MSEIDWQQFRADFDAEWEQNSQPAEEAPTEDVSEVEENVDIEDTSEPEPVAEEATEDVPSSEEQSDTESIDNSGLDSDESAEPAEDAPQLAGEPARQKPKQTPEENRAFAEMRHRLKEMEQYKEVIESLAAQNGVSADLLIQRIKEEQLKAQAERQGLSLEQYQEIESTKQRLNQLEIQYKQREYQDQIKDVQLKYGIKDDNDPKIQRAYEYIRRQGLYDQTTLVPYVKFEDIFKIVNHEALVEEAARKAKQEQLKAKKQRQQQAAPVAHTGGTVEVKPKDFMSMSSEEFQEFLKQRGVSLDY